MIAACLAAGSINQTLQILLCDDEDLPIDGRKRARPGQLPRPDYKNSTWGRMLRDEATELRIAGSTASNLFRRRFRLPYPLFEMLMIDVNLWQRNASSHDVTGREAIPLELNKKNNMIVKSN